MTVIQPLVSSKSIQPMFSSKAIQPSKETQVVRSKRLKSHWDKLPFELQENIINIKIKKEEEEYHNLCLELGYKYIHYIQDENIYNYELRLQDKTRCAIGYVIVDNKIKCVVLRIITTEKTSYNTFPFTIKALNECKIEINNFLGNKNEYLWYQYSMQSIKIRTIYNIHKNNKFFKMFHKYFDTLFESISRLKNVS
jgi:hypothetical protein